MNETKRYRKKLEGHLRVNIHPWRWESVCPYMGHQSLQHAEGYKLNTDVIWFPCKEQTSPQPDVPPLHVITAFKTNPNGIRPANVFTAS